MCGYIHVYVAIALNKYARKYDRQEATEADDDMGLKKFILSSQRMVSEATVVQLPVPF